MKIEEYEKLTINQKMQVVLKAELPKGAGGYVLQIQYLFETSGMKKEDISRELWSVLVVNKPRKLLNRLSQELNCNAFPANVHRALVNEINNR